MTDSDLYTANMIPLGFASAALIFTGPFGTEPFVTTVGMDVTGSPAFSTYKDTANAVFNSYQAEVMPYTSNELTLERVDVSYPAGTGTVSVSSDLAPASGGYSGLQASINNAILVNKITDEPGRRGKGRMFIPGLLGASDTGIDGTLSQAGRDQYQTYITNFVEEVKQDPGSGVAEFVVLHSSPGPIAPAVITSFVVSPKIGSIRRRLR